MSVRSTWGDTTPAFWDFAVSEETVLHTESLNRKHSFILQPFTELLMKRLLGPPNHQCQSPQGQDAAPRASVETGSHPHAGAGTRGVTSQGGGAVPKGAGVRHPTGQPASERQGCERDCVGGVEQYGTPDRGQPTNSFLSVSQGFASSSKPWGVCALWGPGDPLFIPHSNLRENA